MITGLYLVVSSVFLYAQPKIRGNTQRLNTMAQRMPPITTLANGRELSDPIPWETAAGNKPIAAISAVIITGLMRELTPSFREV